MNIKPKVIDISHFDRVLPDGFKQARAFGILGCIHKASEGTSMVDATYAQRRPMAKEAGLLWGAYHFIRPVDVPSQVESFLRSAQPDNNTLLALDYEVDSVSLDDAREFIEAVERKVGRSVVVYSGNTIKEKLGNTADPWWGARRLWLAQYSTSPVVQRSWAKYWLWQFTGDGAGPPPHEVPGIEIEGGLDISHWDGTENELRAQWAGAAAREVSSEAGALTTRAGGQIIQQIDLATLSRLFTMMSPIDKALGGQVMLGLKTPLAIVAYAGMWIMQAFDAVGTATGDKATTTGSVLTALIAAFGGLGLTSKFDHAVKAVSVLAAVAHKLPPVATTVPLDSTR
jgi:hypothetical protein